MTLVIAGASGVVAGVAALLILETVPFPKSLCAVMRKI